MGLKFLMDFGVLDKDAGAGYRRHPNPEMIETDDNNFNVNGVMRLKLPDGNKQDERITGVVSVDDENLYFHNYGEETVDLLCGDLVDNVKSGGSGSVNIDYFGSKGVFSLYFGKKYAGNYVCRITLTVMGRELEV
ncbi:MAG TPA: hypothetical protein VJB06_04710 [archaeon]|nr:hypothetical protein [archaeon]